MSTTPTTTDSGGVAYTVVSARRSERARSMDTRFSVLLLNRRRVLDKKGFIESLERFDPDEIISVEKTENAYEAEALSAVFPKLKILLLPEGVNWGEQINIAMGEARGAHVLVCWSDIRPADSHLSPRQIERIREQSLLCCVPVMATPRAEIMPSLMAPAFYDTTLKLMPFVPVRDGQSSLFPFEYCGVYDKLRYRTTGGYDAALSNPYWQKVEFGFRAHLWGERIACGAAFRLCLEAAPEPEDATPDQAYRRTYLKTLAVRYRNDRAHLPWSKFFRYLSRSGAGLPQAFGEFAAARAWVVRNGYRFRMDAQSLIELWEVGEE